MSRPPRFALLLAAQALVGALLAVIGLTIDDGNPSTFYIVAIVVLFALLIVGALLTRPALARDQLSIDVRKFRMLNLMGYGGVALAIVALLFLSMPLFFKAGVLILLVASIQGANLYFARSPKTEVPA